tara:strand:+ start:145 stop:1701 length:1557 start_codon:yes stop_codon:yes gene_type:complete
MHDMNETAEQIYTKCEGDRYQYLERARTCSRLTLPYVMPDDGFNAHSRLETPFQGIGARGVNNLASKLLLALLPPNAPFFRLNIDEFLLAQEGAPPEVISEIETTLQKVEESLMDEVSAQAYRVGIHEALKHLIVTGNALLYMPDEGGLRVFHLDRYVIKRDPMGNIITIATKETISYKALPEEMQEALSGYSKDITEKCDLYTAITRCCDGYKVYQDIKGIQMPTAGMYKEDNLPYIPLRFSKIDGEDYGRGYVEEYLGDLQSLEKLTQAIVEGSSAAAKVLFLVNPNGTTRARTLADSPNGAITQGNANDISVLQLNKFNDFRIAQETMNGIRDRLGYAFLLSSGAVRNAERVTAEEIRMLSMELEAALGGLYSLLSLELQMPMIKRLMKVMKGNKRVPELPKDIVNPVIITGVEALGRGNDLQKLDLFLQGAAQTVGAQAMSQYLNVSEYFKRRATALGIKTDGLVKSQEEIQEQMQAMQQQAQQEQILKSLGPNAVKAISDQSMQQQQPSEEVE